MATERSYKDHTVTLNNGSMRFDIDGPLVTQNGVHSYQDATERIDRAEAAHKRSKAVRLDLKVINENGQRGAITGIHTVEARTLGLAGRDLYVDLPWVRDAVDRLNAMHKAVAELRNQLAEVEVSTRWGYRRLDAEQFAAAIQSLKDQYAKRMLRAEEIAKEVAKS